MLDCNHDNAGLFYGVPIDQKSSKEFILAALQESMDQYRKTRQRLDKAKEKLTAKELIELDNETPWT